MEPDHAYDLELGSERFLFLCMKLNATAQREDAAWSADLLSGGFKFNDEIPDGLNESPDLFLPLITLLRSLWAYRSSLVEGKPRPSLLPRGSGRDVWPRRGPGLLPIGVPPSCDRLSTRSSPRACSSRGTWSVWRRGCGTTATAGTTGRTTAASVRLTAVRSRRNRADGVRRPEAAGDSVGNGHRAGRPPGRIARVGRAWAARRTTAGPTRPAAWRIRPPDRTARAAGAGRGRTVETSCAPVPVRQSPTSAGQRGSSSQRFQRRKLAR